VTLLARFRGWSMEHPLISAMWYDLIPGSQAFLAIEKLQNHNENLEGIQRFKQVAN